MKGLQCMREMNGCLKGPLARNWRLARSLTFPEHFDIWLCFVPHAVLAIFVRIISTQRCTIRCSLLCCAHVACGTMLCYAALFWDVCILRCTDVAMLCYAMPRYVMFWDVCILRRTGVAMLGAMPCHAMLCYSVAYILYRAVLTLSDVTCCVTL